VAVLNTVGNVFLALLAGLLPDSCRLLNGVIVVGIGLPSLVVTIALSSSGAGRFLVLLNGKSFSLVAAKGSFIYSLLVGKVADSDTNDLVGGDCRYCLDRAEIATALEPIFTLSVITNRRRIDGVNTARTRMLMFALVGVAAAFAGILASLQSLFLAFSGEGYLLSTLPRSFWAAPRFFGGVGTILGTFIGSFIIGAINAAIVAIG